ncbi:MAG: alpha/beta hydrolase, partial [Pseudomonadota bacterium]
MLNKITLVFGLCALIMACTETQDQQSATDVVDAVAPVTGPLTVRAPDGVEIAATVHSIGEPTVVLVHGWMCDQTYWEAQVPALSEYFGVVNVDVAGHGLSGTGRQTWTIASLGDDVAAVIKHLKLENVVVIGHSMGGRVGLEAARLLPESVVGVIGVDDLQDADDDWGSEEAEAFLGDLKQDFSGTCDAFVRSMFGEQADGALMDHVAADMCGGPGEIGMALIRDYINYDLASAMQSTGVPIRSINADKWPTNVEANRKYADFDAVILTGFGHFLMQEATDELNRLLIETV